MERSQQATTGQGSDSVTRKEKEQGISARWLFVHFTTKAEFDVTE